MKSNSKKIPDRLDDFEYEVKSEILPFTTGRGVVAVTEENKLGLFFDGYSILPKVVENLDPFAFLGDRPAEEGYYQVLRQFFPRVALERLSSLSERYVEPLNSLSKDYDYLKDLTDTFVSNPRSREKILRDDEAYFSSYILDYAEEPEVDTVALERFNPRKVARDFNIQDEDVLAEFYFTIPLVRSIPTFYSLDSRDEFQREPIMDTLEKYFCKAAGIQSGKELRKKKGYAPIQNSLLEPIRYVR